MSKRYWKASLEELLPEHGIVVTEQLINDIYIIREMESEACGYDTIANPLRTELDAIKRELEKEKDKVGCDECGGRGCITSSFGIRSATSQCSKCNGSGKISKSNRNKV